MIAVGAKVRSGTFAAAMVAGENRTLAVQHHTRVAAGTLDDLAATRAHQRWCIPPSIEKQKHLAISVQVMLHRCDQRLGQAIVRRLNTQVDEPDGWWACHTSPARQFEAG